MPRMLARIQPQRERRVLELLTNDALRLLNPLCAAPVPTVRQSGHDQCKRLGVWPGPTLVVCTRGGLRHFPTPPPHPCPNMEHRFANMIVGAPWICWRLFPFLGPQFGNHTSCGSVLVYWGLWLGTWRRALVGLALELPRDARGLCRGFKLQRTCKVAFFCAAQ